MPPSWHPVPAGTPRRRCRRAVLLCRSGSSRRAVLSCSSDGAAVIPKSGPEIKNRCSRWEVAFCRRNHSPSWQRILESDAEGRYRDGRCRRAIPHCCDDGAAVIPKLTPSNQESLHTGGRFLAKTCSDSQIDPLKSRITARNRA